MNKRCSIAQTYEIRKYTRKCIVHVVATVTYLIKLITFVGVILVMIVATVTRAEELFGEERDCAVRQTEHRQAVDA